MIETLHKIVEAVGLLGGILYLILLGRIVWHRHRHPPMMIDGCARVPHIHVVPCTLCGENAHNTFECKHPDAPLMGPFEPPVKP